MNSHLNRRTFLHNTGLSLGGAALSSLLLRDDNEGSDESYVWITPSERFPEGSYLVRVEAWRRNSSMHLSYHQERIFIER